MNKILSTLGSFLLISFTFCMSMDSNEKHIKIKDGCRDTLIRQALMANFCNKTYYGQVEKFNNRWSGDYAYLTLFHLRNYNVQQNEALSRLEKTENKFRENIKYRPAKIALPALGTVLGVCLMYANSKSARTQPTMDLITLGAYLTTTFSLLTCWYHVATWCEELKAFETCDNAKQLIQKFLD